MRADLGAFLDHDHIDFGRDLLELDGGGEPGGARADDHDVELHRFAGGQLFGGFGHRPSSPLFSTFAQARQSPRSAC